MKNWTKRLLFFLIIIQTLSHINLKPEEILKSHLSSGWYPQSSEKLENELEKYFDIAKNNFNVKVDPNSVKIIVAPHAGYFYSGLCATSVYQTFLDNNKKNRLIKKVIVLSPSHTIPINGIAIPTSDFFENVLGKIKIDKKAIDQLKQTQFFIENENVFNKEHAIEIQIPFLQKTIESFELIPLIVGNINNQDYETIAKILGKIVDDSTLIVISSDFIHFGENYGYKPFQENILDNIRMVDSRAVEAITNKSFDQFSQFIANKTPTICGRNCIKLVLKLFDNGFLKESKGVLTSYYTSAQMMEARKTGKIRPELLLKNIDDSQVTNSVSYVGMIFSSEKIDSQLTQFEQKSLLNLAKRSIENSFKKKKLADNLLLPIKSSGMQKTAGAFVTLHKKPDLNLRGCIGRIVTNQPLYKTVYEMAQSAAFHDSRFYPLKKDELNQIEIDITVLTKPKPVTNIQETVLGKHGIVFKKSVNGRYYSSVFLPQVPLNLGWNLEKTLEQLSLKAGLGKDDWKKEANFEIFEGFEIK